MTLPAAHPSGAHSRAAMTCRSPATAPGTPAAALVWFAAVGSVSATMAVADSHPLLPVTQRLAQSLTHAVPCMDRRRQDAMSLPLSRAADHLKSAASPSCEAAFRHRLIVRLLAVLASRLVSSSAQLGCGKYLRQYHPVWAAMVLSLSHNPVWPPDSSCIVLRHFPQSVLALSHRSDHRTSDHRHPHSPCAARRAQTTASPSRRASAS